MQSVYARKKCKHKHFFFSVFTWHSASGFSRSCEPVWLCRLAQDGRSLSSWLPRSVLGSVSAQFWEKITSPSSCASRTSCVYFSILNTIERGTLLRNTLIKPTEGVWKCVWIASNNVVIYVPTIHTQKHACTHTNSLRANNLANCELSNKKVSLKHLHLIVHKKSLQSVKK